MPRHPARRTRHLPRDEFEGAADADEHRTQLAPHRVDEQFLLGRAERDEDQVRRGLADAFDDRSPLHRIERIAQPRSVDARDRHAALPQHASCLLRAPRRSAQQVDAVSAQCSALHETRHEIGARDLLRNRVSQEPRRPHERHSVRDAQARAGIAAAEGLVFPGQHDVVDVGSEHCSAAARADQIVDGVDRSGECHAVDFDRADRDPVAHFRPPRATCVAPVAPAIPWSFAVRRGGEHHPRTPARIRR